MVGYFALATVQYVFLPMRRSWIRSYDTEARQRDDMTRHWDLHRQMIVTTQDKYTQFNTMWAARDDIYRKRREEAFQRRIKRYQDANDLVTQRTDEFCARRDRILDPNANGSTYPLAVMCYCLR